MNVWTYSTLALIIIMAGVVVIGCAIMSKGNGDE